MPAEFYCDLAGTELGPLSFKQLRVMARQGRLHPDDRIKQGRDGAWTVAGKVKGLFAADRAAASETPVAGAAPATRAVKPLDLPVARPAAKSFSPAQTPPAAPRAPAASQAPPASAAPAAQNPSAPPRAMPAGQALPAAPRPAPAPVAARAPGKFPAVAPAPTAGRASAQTASTAVPARKKKDRGPLVLVVLVLVVVGLAAAGLAMAFGLVGFSRVAEGPGRAAPVSKSPEDLAALEEKGLKDAAPAAQSSGAGTTAPAAEPAPTTPTPTAPDRWVDASKDAYRRDGVSVKVVSATTGDARVSAPGGRIYRTKEPCLSLRIQLENGREDDKLEYTSFSLRDAAEQASLTDNLGNEYRMKRFAGVAVHGGITRESVEPAGSVEDQIIFDRPVSDPKLRYLRLELPASAIGQGGVLKFEIPAAMIVEDVTAAREPGPPGAGEGPARETRPPEAKTSDEPPDVLDDPALGREIIGEPDNAKRRPRTEPAGKEAGEAPPWEKTL